MSQQSRPIPISAGSSAFAELDCGPFRVTTVDFEGGCRIEPHHHDRPNIGVILGGSFELSFARRTLDCLPGTLFVEPAGETHCNCMGIHGACVLALQPDPAFSQFPDAVLSALSKPSSMVLPNAMQIGRRIAREISHNDEFTTLTVQGLACELTAEVARSHVRAIPATAPSLERIEQMLIDEPAGRVTIAALANEAKVHSVHLARSFRERYGRSLGSFLLERRLEWAARELVTTARPISELALAAGFADQSHFTRRFRVYAGVTPRQFRLSRRAGNA